MLPTGERSARPIVIQWSQICLKVISKLSKSCIKVGSKLYCLKVVSKLFQSCPKVVSNLSQNCLKVVPSGPKCCPCNSVCMEEYNLPFLPAALLLDISLYAIFRTDCAKWQTHPDKRFVIIFTQPDFPARNFTH